MGEQMPRPNPKRLQRIAARQAAARASSPKIDFLFEVPNLGLADGYGQAARSIIRMFMEICNEEKLNMRLLDIKHPITSIRLKGEFEAFNKIMIDSRNTKNVDVYMRFSLPALDRHSANTMIAMTMFETDNLPPAWIDPLNAADLIVTPTEWGAGVFRKYTTPRVVTIPLPIDSRYYSILPPGKLFPSETKFRFITVGNYFDPDRKRIIPLIRAFGEKFKGKNCELYVKTSWLDEGSTRALPIDKICEEYDNVILDRSLLDTDALIRLYCSSHAALYPSVGEGYGLPHMESALLGRPLVITNNTSMTSMSKYLPWCTKVECTPIKSDYTPQHIFGDCGNWFEGNMGKFIQKANKLFTEWEASPRKYNQKILDAHTKETLRDYISHENIKEMFRELLLSQIGKSK
jgi:hypothetical protein